jgi:hypothetical protein
MMVEAPESRKLSAILFTGIEGLGRDSGVMTRFNNACVTSTPRWYGSCYRAMAGVR